MDDWKRIRENMEDAGCDDAAIARAGGLYSAGETAELIRCLRACRCEQLEALHVRQKQLDRLDDLIRRTQSHPGAERRDKNMK